MHIMQLQTTTPAASRVGREINDTAVLALYQTWKAASTCARLPTFESLNLARGNTLEKVFVAEVVELAPFTLRTIHMGLTLRAQLGRELDNDGMITSDNEDVLGDLKATYRRCMRLREPSYESMRMTLGDGKPTRFERLLLPCASADGAHHYLVGMVVLENLN
jgi:hypothetical protein